MLDKKRSKKQIERRKISDRSFKIWNPDGSLYAETFEGKWIKKPKEIKENKEVKKMPVKRCRLNNKPGWKWGDEGKCYTYKAGNKKSEAAARLKASKQGVAISRESGEKFEP